MVVGNGRLARLVLGLGGEAEGWKGGGEFGRGWNVYLKVNYCDGTIDLSNCFP